MWHLGCVNPKVCGSKSVKQFLTGLNKYIETCKNTCHLLIMYCVVTMRFMVFSGEFCCTTEFKILSFISYHKLKLDQWQKTVLIGKFLCKTSDIVVFKYCKNEFKYH